MATVALIIGGALLNAGAFTGFNELARYLYGDKSKSAEFLAERKRHDKALEEYQNEMGAWQKKRQQYKDWIEKNYQEKMAADKNFENTDYAFKLYALMHPDRAMSYLRQKPVFKYVPSERQKKDELLFVGLGGLALGAAVGYLF